jgi:hypothetical protein
MTARPPWVRSAAYPTDLTFDSTRTPCLLTHSRAATDAVLSLATRYTKVSRKVEIFKGTLKSPPRSAENDQGGEARSAGGDWEVRVDAKEACTCLPSDDPTTRGPGRAIVIFTHSGPPLAPAVCEHENHHPSQANPSAARASPPASRANARAPRGAASGPRCPSSPYRGDQRAALIAGCRSSSGP